VTEPKGVGVVFRERDILEAEQAANSNKVIDEATAAFPITPGFVLTGREEHT
jgi:hypothetical protein